MRLDVQEPTKMYTVKLPLSTIKKIRNFCRKSKITHSQLLSNVMDCVHIKDEKKAKRK